jgi:molybdopterin synthase sulfur carrier subunit
MSISAIQVHIRYFAILRDERGRSEESLATAAATAWDLYEELRSQHKLSLAPEHLRVAINDRFEHWDTPLHAGDRIVFIPPVAGG